MLQWGFHTSKLDTSLFIQHIEGELVVVLIYVDDILVTGSHTRFVEKKIHLLGTEYALKNLENLIIFLVLKSHHHMKDSIFLRPNTLVIYLRRHRCWTAKDAKLL